MCFIHIHINSLLYQVNIGTNFLQNTLKKSLVLFRIRDLLVLFFFQSNADASISRHVISSDHYHVITTLIQYYQMEIRWSIRQLLLQAFGVLCSLDKTVINIMLNSVLPGELAR